MWVFVFIGVQWGAWKTGCSSVCSHFSPFIFSVFFLESIHWSLRVLVFFSHSVSFYALCPIFRTIFGLHFGVLWGSLCFSIYSLSLSTIFLVSVSSQFVPLLFRKCSVFSKHSE